MDSQGNLITVVDRKVEIQQDGQMLDRFIDRNNNVYLERPHNEEFDATELISSLKDGAIKFYQLQSVRVDIGRVD